MWEHSGKVAIAGLGHSRVYRRWDEAPETSLGGLALAAAREAIADAGISLEDIDGIISGPGPLGGRWARPVPPGVAEAFQQSEDPEDGISMVTATWLARNLGVKELNVLEDVNGMVSALANYAFEVVASGQAKTVLLIRPLNNFAGRYHQTEGAAESGREEARGGAQFWVPWGQPPEGATWAAAMFSRYLWKYNEKHEHLADFAVNNRRNGLMLEYGYYYQNRPEELTREDYLGARWIAEPVNIYDCDLPVHAAAAYLITTGERARDMKRPPVYVHAIVESGSPMSAPRTRVNPRPNHCFGWSSGMMLEDMEAYAADLGKRMWEASALGPKDMSFANVYDGFMTFAPHWIEAFGFCDFGEGVAFLTPDRIAVEGSFPINTSGGNMGAGRTHGVSHLYDAVIQMRGEAGPRQVKDRDACLVHVGPPLAGAAQVLTRVPR